MEWSPCGHGICSTPAWNFVHPRQQTHFAGFREVLSAHALSLSAHKNFGARHFLVKKLYLYRRKRLIKKNSKHYENA